MTKLVFTLDADDLRLRDEITTAGVIDGKLARGDYEVLRDELDDDVRFLLDGLGVPDIATLKQLVDVGQAMLATSDAAEQCDGAAV